jgi:hypothetical protein
MIRWNFLGLLAVLVMAFLAGAGLPADQPKATGHHDAHTDHCARACADCMRECESCLRHCADMVAAGKKDHFITMGTCADCADFCAAAAKIVSRRGPMAMLICESCAKACDTCGAACAKQSADEHMQRCAKACKDCAQACREMIKHGGGAPARP